MPLREPTRYILLADDDRDDTSLFVEILRELPFPAQVSSVLNGEQLLRFLNEHIDHLPDVLFLDLNMPRKNGFECLVELQKDPALKKLPVIIFTTSNEPSVINLLYKTGAWYYIRKPNTVNQLKNLIQRALILVYDGGISKPSREEFELSSHPVNEEYS